MAIEKNKTAAPVDPVRMLQAVHDSLEGHFATVAKDASKAPEMAADLKGQLKQVLDTLTTG